MAGIFTDKRDRSRPFTVRRFNDAGVELTPVSGKYADVQETTSYRSGRELSEAESLIQDSRIFGSPRELRGPHDTGHEFQTYSRKFISTNVESYALQYKNKVIVLGPLIYQNGASTDTLSACPVISPLGASDVVGYGQRAISASAPTNPVAGIAGTIGEVLRDGIPKIPGLQALADSAKPGSIRRKAASSVGGEFLNVEFGWKPLVSDLTKLVTSVRNASRTVRQLSRDSGADKSVRRRISFPVELSYKDGIIPRDSLNNLVVGFNTAQARVVGDIRYTDEILRNIWFSGAFSYYLPLGDDIVSKATRYEALANKVLGTRLTPSVLYQLAPWSWLLDWFVDFGGAIKAADLLTSDNLVLKYGYLMCHTNVTRTIRFVVETGDGTPDYPRKQTTVQCKFRSERKERWRASPFGFALTPAGFSAHQWSILGALGLTRAHRVAW